MKKLLFLSFLLMGVISLNSLAWNSGKKKLNRTNLKEMVAENSFTNFGTVIYHASDEKSRVYLDVKLKDLKYLGGQNKKPHYARYKVFYELYPNYESKTISDSAALFFTDTLNYGVDANMVVDFDISAAFPGEYVLKISLTDLNRKENNVVFNIYKVSKTSQNSSQNFMVVDEDNNPLFVKHIKDEQYFKILCNQKDNRQLMVRYYNCKLPIAKTPFAVDKNITFNFKADSLYDISMTNGESVLLKLPFDGIYHFQQDTTQVEGFTLFHFDDGFPEIETPLQAILPLRYLTTQKEFDALLKYQDYKVAVDSFWLERASGQAERAKNMIAKYYLRVVLANKMFTSYQEGWKTDRGIIYIIYGPPTELYRKTGEEQWIYGERGNPLTINFYFDEVENPFTLNDYSMQRSTAYKSSWYIAIENWRR
jgi:GWxTD domain-containing protein